MPFDVRDEPYEITDKDSAEVQRHDEPDPVGDINQPRTQYARDQAEMSRREKRETSETADSPGPRGVEITFDTDEVLEKLGVLGTLGGLL